MFDFILIFFFNYNFIPTIISFTNSESWDMKIRINNVQKPLYNFVINFKTYEGAGYQVGVLYDVFQIPLLYRTIL